MDEVYFLVRFTPFWAVPLLLISAEFAYISWVRKKSKWVFTCLFLTVISSLCLVFYYWAGGPERSVELLVDFVRFYSE